MAEGFEERQKRKRSANWDSLEKHLLRTCMMEFIEIIENKNTDTNTNKNKNIAWIQLTQRFNEMNDKERTLVEVKQQWRTMKLDAKKERRQLNGTDGGPKPQSPGHETNEIRTNRKRKHSHDAPDSMAKERNSVLIECIKEEHELKMKQMVESHIWAKEESQLRIENLKLDIILKAKLIDK